MSDNRAIGILDSGVGGLTGLKQMEEILPKESIVYIGDSKRMPYGNKTKEEIIFLANKMIAYLEKENVKAILLACNTISSYINELNSNVKLFSIIEGGVSSLSEENPYVGLIATKATVENKGYEKLIAKRNKNITLISNDSTFLPKVINSHIENTALLDSLIKECIDPIIEKKPNITDLILGCSHFPIITKEINALYPTLKLIDPAENLVLNLKEYLKENNMLCANNEKTTVLYTTADTFEFAAAIKRLFLDIEKLEKIKLLEKD